MGPIGVNVCKYYFHTFAKHSSQLTLQEGPELVDETTSRRWELQWPDLTPGCPVRPGLHRRQQWTGLHIGGYLGRGGGLGVGSV